MTTSSYPSGYVPTLQHDGQVWYVFGRGVEEDGKTWCHLASVHHFTKQKNGNVPVQICDWVDNEKLKRAGF